jgi:Fe-Mn family superoxide dismutase
MNSTDRTLMNRRDALKILGTGVAFAGLGLGRAEAGEEAAGASLGWELPKLAYSYDAMEPQIDARTMEIHHTKHHQAYLNNALKLLEAQPALRARGPAALVRDLNSVPEAMRPGIRNNAGGHVNHTFFWKIIGPPLPTGSLAAKLSQDYGSIDEFKKQFSDAALKRFGSGWAWLSRKPEGGLVIHSTANQDSPLSDGLTPIIGLDVWEHAYYLKYQNRRADYVAAFWQVLNWTQAELNYAVTAQG